MYTKKSKNLQKITCIKKKNYFPPTLPHQQQLCSIHIKQKHTKNYETFVEFKKLLRFFFFLSYTTQYKREELRKSYENQHFINKKR